MASFVPFLLLPMTRELLKRVLCTVLNETTSSAEGHHENHKGLSAEDCQAQNLAGPRR